MVQEDTLFVPSLRVTGNVLRCLDCFHPLVDIPDLSFLGDFCGGMYHIPAIHVRTFPFATVWSSQWLLKLNINQTVNDGVAHSNI